MGNKINEEKKGSHDLLLETLTQMGCQYDIDEGENGNIYFAFQGENFTVTADNDCSFIHIYDAHWLHVDLYDIDEFARLKKAINDANIKNSVTTIYTIIEAEKTVNVHTISTLLFIPEIPEIADLLRLELNEFFKAHRTIDMEMAKLREQELAL